MEILEVLDPVAQQIGVINARSVNKRPPCIESTRVGLLWSGTSMGDVALRRLEEMLKQKFPTVKTSFYHGGLPAPDAVLATVAEESDIVIGATAD